MPHFGPLGAPGGRHRLGRLLRHRRRAVAAAVAVTAAALAVTALSAAARVTPDAVRDGPPRGHPARAAGAPPGSRDGASEADRTVTVPVRVADAATVRLLRPGDRVDVIAVQDPAAGGRARVVARGARVTRVPRPPDRRDARSGTAQDMSSVMAAGEDPAGAGDAGNTLVALAVPRSAATRLAGAGATDRLAVTLW
ncbi:RcpC/CpaB family pilus assembly protein [Streptomyces sp. NPDC047017]|uniref:RcpC/CpaB family pilus assembly protein n=1 Tax=Streptomyces sp. NPDC047017 TaxID=3155024 RepID=UPI0033F134FA